MKAEGYFYSYRGNGYGSFKTREEAIEDFNDRRFRNSDYEHGAVLMYGTAIVNEDKRLQYGSKLENLEDLR